MLRMRSNVSASFLAVTSYSCKVNTMVLVILSKICYQIWTLLLIIQVKASKFATYS